MCVRARGRTPIVGRVADFCGASCFTEKGVKSDSATRVVVVKCERLKRRNCASDRACASPRGRKRRGGWRGKRGGRSRSGSVVHCSVYGAVDFDSSFGVE